MTQNQRAYIVQSEHDEELFMLYLATRRRGLHEHEGAEARREDARRDEGLRAQQLARVVACTLRQLREETHLTRAGAEALIATTRDAALDLVPGSEATYNLVLAPRFARLLDQRFGSTPRGPGARVLPFRARRGDH
jgi:hypothetical protein